MYRIGLRCCVCDKVISSLVSKHQQNIYTFDTCIIKKLLVEIIIWYNELCY